MQNFWLYKNILKIHYCFFKFFSQKFVQLIKYCILFNGLLRNCANYFIILENMFKF